MRRRPKAANDPTAPPAELLAFTGTTNRERFAWLRAREDWWATTHPDPETVGDLRWVAEGHDQAGDFDWCGSVGDPCADPDCLCTTWPEPLEPILPDA